MRGYTFILREALADLPQPPAHVFLQAGDGGSAAAVAGHLAVLPGKNRPHVTVMAMLVCHAPSLAARIGLDAGPRLPVSTIEGTAGRDGRLAVIEASRPVAPTNEEGMRDAPDMMVRVVAAGSHDLVEMPSDPT